MVLQLRTSQALLLTLLDAFSGKVGNLDFHNFLFLYCQELNLADTNVNYASLYEFVPYKFRPFSFICNTDRRRLFDSDLPTDGSSPGKAEQLPDNYKMNQ